ncbi:hypothetical protein ONS96_011117 [Cadophora gregata f. sp. sojae]|nr:hypothetical protein ONS96_011117 [Cadophora gregata f. sp. sojae]
MPFQLLSSNTAPNLQYKTNIHQRQTIAPYYHHSYQPLHGTVPYFDFQYSPGGIRSISGRRSVPGSPRCITPSVLYSNTSVQPFHFTVQSGLASEWKRTIEPPLPCSCIDCLSAMVRIRAQCRP